MSKGEEAENLQYGQGILISGFTTGKEDKGYLTAKGFADTMAIYQTYKDKLYFKNYRNAIFQIVPAANFELNDQLRRLRQIYTEDNANMKILEARSASEAEQFDLLKKAKKGNKVCFGDLVIFKHADSDTYLSGTIEPSGGTNGAFLVEVTKELKEILIFKVLPYRSYQKIGMAIPFDSPVQLQNMYNNGFLTYEKIGISVKEKKFDLQKKPIEADDSYVIPVKTKSSQSQIYECVTHFMDLSKEPQSEHAQPTPMPWRFDLHITDIDDTQSLIQHDIIYFQHTQNKGILSTKGMDIILKEMKAEGGEELPFYQCLWEVEKHDISDEAYILRHLMSGMTLGIKKDSQGKPIKAMLFDISEGTAQNNLGYVEIKLAKKEKADIKSGSYINICEGDWCLDKEKPGEAIEGVYDQEKSDDFVHIPKLNKLAVNELEYNVEKANFTTEISKNCFMIKQIEDDLKKQCLFALSFHAKIIQLRQDLKWGWQDSQETIKYRRLMLVTEKIKEIKNFLKNCSKEESDLEYIRPIFKHQMICKDLGISELLFELLFYMKKNFMDKYVKVGEGEVGPGYIFHQVPNSWGKFWELYNAIYEVIYELVRDNLLFKIYVSKWINFVIQDVLVENEPSHLNLLKELFKNNQFLVKNFVDAVLIQKFSNRMLRKSSYKFYEIKYLEIFRLFCIVGDTVHTGNQIILLQKFIKALKKTSQSEMYQITVSKQTSQPGKKEIYTDAAIDKNQIKKRRFNDYKKICKEEYQTAWDYFVEYINLLADMTRGRNKLVEDYIKGMFSADILTDLFLNQSLEEAEPSIIRLLHNLYIESDPYYAIDKKKRISEYSLIQNEKIDVMNAEKTKPWEAQSLMKILNGVLNKLKVDYGPIDPKDVLKNECLYQYLRFIWQTLELGFWQTKEHIKKILDVILKILVPHDSVKSDYAKSSIASRQNSLMMNCKLECMNIIEQILDYDLDLSVRLTCQSFQSFKMAEKMRPLKREASILHQRIDDGSAKDFIEKLPKDKEMSLVDISIITQMIELSRYNNPRLTSGSISIVERVLLKSKKSIDSFTKQLFACEDLRLSLKQKIEEHKEKFYIMQDQSIIKILSEADQTDNYVAVYKEDLNPASAGIMQVINMMSEVIKHEVDINDYKQYLSLESGNLIYLLGGETLLNFTDERNSSDYIKQSVLDAENIHLKVLEFVRNCREVPPDGSLSKKLLHLSYKFLVSLIWNNEYVKPTLISYLPDLQHHLRKNVGCIDFLKEMYDNNKTLLFSYEHVCKLIKEICNSINAEPQGSYYKSKLLDFFRFLIYCNGKSLKNNQILILKIMQDDSYSNILLNVDSRMIEDLVRDYVSSYQAFEKNFHNKKIQVSPKLTYLITYFQIMESLIDDKCAVNMGKLKKTYPFEKLLEWLKKSDTCWPLKRNIRCLINRMYYFQPEIEVYMKEIVDKELDNIIRDLNGYILIKSNNAIADIENFRFENPIRFTYMESYLYLHLEENLFTLYMLATDRKIGQEMKSVLHPVDTGSTIGPKNFIRICERLGWIKNYFTERKNTFTNSFIKFLLSRFKIVINEFDDEIYLPGMELPSGQKRAPMKSEKEEARKGLIDKIMRGDIGTFFVQVDPMIHSIKPLVYSVPNKLGNPKDDRQPNKTKLINKLRQILSRPKTKHFPNKDAEIDCKLSWLVRAIKLSKEGEKLLSQDYYKKLNESTEWKSLKKYIEIIIEMNSKDRQALPVPAKKFFLNLVTGTIEQGNKTKREFKTLDKWEAEDWTPSKEVINQLQNQLKLCKLGTFISELLKQPIWENVQFADSILLCGIAYIFGGFSNTQKDMIDILRQDRDNRVMRNLEHLISKLGQFIVKNIEESSKQEKEDANMFSITTIDNYDFYRVATKHVLRKNVLEPETTDEQIHKNTCIRTYQRAFKFLQLLCQNNNVDGKTFIQNQKNQLKNFDFIKIAAKEIRNIFLFLTPEVSEVSLFLLDFILEVTQIPVKSNQEALLNLTFFEDLCALHNVFYNKPDVVSIKGFDNADKKKELDAIFQKGILIILSCFEGNEHKTFKAIDNKLEPKFLTNILKENLGKLGLKTKEEAIDYVENWQEFQFEDSMKAVLNVLIIFLKLKEKLGEEKSRVYSIYNNERNLNKDFYAYLESLLLNIEIVNSGTPQIVYFPKYPVFNSLTAGLRDTIMNQVERASHRDKIVSLQGYSSAIKNKIESSYQLEKTEKITEKHMNDAFRISAVMSIVICVFMIMYYDVIINYQEADFEAPRTTGLVRFAISLVQLSMALVYGYYWLKFKIWESPERKARVETKKPLPEGDGNEDKNWLSRKIAQVYDYCQRSGIRKKITEFHQIFKGGKTTQPLYLSAEFWRVAIYVIVSFVGTFFYPPLYFIHVMDIFCYNPEIGDIFKAIGLNFSELVYVSFMGVLFTFVFCTVTFSNYMKNVFSGDEAEQDRCQTMLDCILQLYVSGAIGQTMQTFEITRFTYDTIYGIFFGTMLANIISGIMLDAFGSLRDKNGALQEDKDNLCYICNVERATLEEKKLSFQAHINGPHFLWNYVFYVYYLDGKSQTDYSGLEYQITAQYNLSDEDMKIDWVPVVQTDQFDSKDKLQELNVLIDQKTAYLDQSKAAIEEELKNLRKMLEV